MAFSKLFVHLVWSTKEREPLLLSPFREKILGHLGVIAKDMKVEPIIINGVTDHVHLLLRFPTHISVADCVRNLKSKSSKRVNDRAGRTFMHWQEKYGAFSVNIDVVERVKDYIANQQAHHRKETYQDEIRRVLKETEIPFDEKYMWD